MVDATSQAFNSVRHMAGQDNFLFFAREEVWEVVGHYKHGAWAVMDGDLRERKVDCGWTLENPCTK